MLIDPHTRDATVVVEEFNDFFVTEGMRSAQLAKDVAQIFELPTLKPQALSKEYFPSEWKISEITPIPKNDDY